MKAGSRVILTIALVFMSLHLSFLASKKGEEGDDYAVVTVDGEDVADVSMFERVNADFRDELDPNVGPFIPTKEWQTIKEGQSIPRGLHVRMNLQTGLKEAKLLDKSEDKPQGLPNIPNPEPGRLRVMKDAIEGAINELKTNEESSDEDDPTKYLRWKEGEKQGMVNTDKDHFTPHELKQALKKFKASQDDVQDEKVREDSVKKQYRKIDELMEDFRKMNLNVKSDQEILKGLMEIYAVPDLDVEDRIKILTDIEYYVHQIDNAQDFASMGGLGLVIKDLNNTEADVRSEVAHVLGSAVQSNPKVQIQVLETGALQQLLRMLATDPVAKVRTRSMYALSALVRHFPFAQTRLVEFGGVATLASLFTQPSSDQIKVKAVTLVNDLLTEKKFAEEHSNPDDSGDRDRLKQYQQTSLQELIISHGWCEHIPSLLQLPDHDVREKVLNAMLTLIDSCHEKFTHSENILKILKPEYEQLSVEEIHEQSDDTYFSDMLGKVTGMIQKLSLAKDEL